MYLQFALKFIIISTFKSSLGCTIKLILTYFNTYTTLLGLYSSSPSHSYQLAGTAFCVTLWPQSSYCSFFFQPLSDLRSWPQTVPFFVIFGCKLETVPKGRKHYLSPKGFSFWILGFSSKQNSHHLLRSCLKIGHFPHYNDSRELKQHPFTDFDDKMSTCVAPT